MASRAGLRHGLRVHPELPGTLGKGIIYPDGSPRPPRLCTIRID